MRYIFLIIGLLWASVGFSQNTIRERFLLVGSATSLESTVNDSTYIINALWYSDQTGNNYYADSIEVGDRLVDYYMKRYRVDSILSTTVNTAQLRLVRTSGAASPGWPIGVIWVYEALPNYDLIPLPQSNAAGINPIQVSRAQRHNVSVIDSLLTGGGTDDQTAAEVPVTPTGNLNSTDVQAALEEHQSDIDALSSGAADGVTTAGVYDATNEEIDFTVSAPGTNFSVNLSPFKDSILAAEGDPVWIADSINYATKTYTDQAEQDAKDYADANDDSGTDDQTLQEVLNEGNTTSSNIVFTGNNNINNTSGQLIGTISSNGDIFRGWSSLGSANRLDIGYLSSFNTIFRSAGNIGIATLSPSEKLHLGGSMFINKENAGLIVDSGSNKRVGLMKYSGLEASFVHGNTIPLRFGRVDQANVTGGNYTEEMRIATNGNVGIGTTGPQYKLEVNGTVGFSSISDGSSHANIVTQDDVTGELGYRDISSIDLWEFNPRRVDDYQIDSIYSPQFFGVRAINPQAGVTTPGNGDFFYVANFGSVTHGLQLAIPYGVSTELYYRGGTDNPLSENGSQVWKNWRKLLTEDDVSTSDVTNWNTAYGWGDHSVAGYLTSEVDGSTTNELQTIDEVLTQGNSLVANRSINVNGNQMQIGGTYAAMLARTFDVTLSSFDLSLNTADIITDTGEIILRHRLQGDVADQDYMYLKAAGLDLAHRNNISLNSDSLSINAPTLTLDQNTTLQSGGFSLTNEMTGSSFYRINTSDAVVNIQPNYIDQTVDGLSGDTKILQGFGGINISRATTGDTGYPDYILMDNDTLSLNHTEQINIDAPIIEINGEKMRTGGPQQVAISGTSGSINLGSLRSQVVQIDMTSASTASPISITITNPISNGTYTFHWQNTDSGGHDLDLPANMLNAAGTAFDGSTTITYTEDDWFTCYYDGTNFYCK